MLELIRKRLSKTSRHMESTFLEYVVFLDSILSEKHDQVIMRQNFRGSYFHEKIASAKFCENKALSK